MPYFTTAQMDERQHPSRPMYRNRILAALPPEEIAIVQPLLSRVNLVVSQVLFENRTPPDAVYFVEQGLVALVTEAGGGDTIQVALTGFEGVRGAAIMLQPELVTDNRTQVEIAGSAYRIRSADFQLAVSQAPVLAALCIRYIHAFVGQIARTAACNGRHDLHRRLCRLLLMAHDRSEDDDILLTQSQIADMIGVRRAGVSTVMAALHDSGHIMQARGRVTILNRRGIIGMACECHAGTPID